MRNIAFTGLLFAGMTISLLACDSARAANPFASLLPFKRIEADPNKSYNLTKADGPWMILVASFAGPGSKKQADELVRLCIVFPLFPRARTLFLSL